MASRLRVSASRTWLLAWTAAARWAASAYRARSIAEHDPRVADDAGDVGDKVLDVLGGPL
ncbi:hypothetical protein [Frankia gtarii]|uniref:hypothetical protein n=1 Tax=Frankia gtarii TaxID=2950102 RepID=UPI0021BEC15E|nr:hypothetical protein [Frankia gtarii]